MFLVVFFFCWLIFLILLLCLVDIEIVVYMLAIHRMCMSGISFLYDVSGQSRKTPSSAVCTIVKQKAFWEAFSYRYCYAGYCGAKMDLNVHLKLSDAVQLFNL